MVLSNNVEPMPLAQIAASYEEPSALDTMSDDALLPIAQIAAMHLKCFYYH